MRLTGRHRAFKEEPNCLKGRVGQDVNKQWLGAGGGHRPSDVGLGGVYSHTRRAGGAASILALAYGLTLYSSNGITYVPALYAHQHSLLLQYQPFS